MADKPHYSGDSAMTAHATSHTPAPRLIEVTVVLLERALPSSAVAPIEIFGTVGRLWNLIHGQPSAPRFRVRTVSLDGRPTQHAVPLGLRPDGAFRDVRHTDLIVIPTAEFDMNASQ